MQKTYTSVLARRVRIDGDFATLPYEAGWASEAVFFIQTEGAHPALEIAVEVSPDGINWIRRSRPVELGADDAIASGRSEASSRTPNTSSRVLIHVNLKG